MPRCEYTEGIAFNNIRIELIHKCSGIFAGSNIQYQWSSSKEEISSFGKITGEMNRFEHSVNISVSPDTAPETIKAVLKDFRESGVYQWSG